MKVLYLIPARGGSKGIPGKNIKRLGEKPLIQYTIEAARQVSSDENICVSTDEETIKAYVEQQLNLKVQFLRPAELATDQASSESVIRHALSFYKTLGRHYEIVILLQPTSPFRTYRHIMDAQSIMTPNLDMVVSVKKTKSNPYYVLYEEDENGLLVQSKESNFTRRQDCPEVFELNGAIYVINVSSLEKKTMSTFKQVVKYKMDDIASLDIDDHLDWILAEEIAKRKLT